MKVALFVAFAALSPGLAAQAPTTAQVQQALQQQPGLGDAVRNRIAQSGLTADQIRARLSASGYPSTLLDAYITATGPMNSPAPGAQELAALQALGLPSMAGQALPYDTGLVRSVRTAPSDVFGVDVFQRTTTQFLPLLAGPVPADYKLGPGDNLTLDQLRDVLYTRLGRVYSGVRRGENATTRFDVTVANVRANQVYVVGEVAQPCAYQISSLGTVFTALYAAGGVTERAKLRGIDVRRLGKTVATLDLYDYLLRGDTRNDIRMETGDVIFVPIHESRVRMSGAVLRPAVYETKTGETLADMLAAAGGFRPDAALERVKVERFLPPEARGTQTTARVTIDVPMTKGLAPRFALEDGDVVHVDSLAGAS